MYRITLIETTELTNKNGKYDNLDMLKAKGITYRKVKVEEEFHGFCIGDKCKIIDNTHPQHYYKQGAVVTVVRFGTEDEPASVECTDGRLDQYVNINDLIRII